MLKAIHGRYPGFFYVWTVMSTVVTISFVSLLLAYITVMFYYDKDGPIIEVSDVTVYNKKVKSGGVLNYSLWQRTIEVCPGDVVTTFRSLNPADNGEVFTVRRPVSYLGVSSPPRINYSVQLPPIAVGEWNVTISIDSRCPLRSRLDVLFSFDLEIVS